MHDPGNSIDQPLEMIFLRAVGDPHDITIIHEVALARRNPSLFRCGRRYAAASDDRSNRLKPNYRVSVMVKLSLSPTSNNRMPMMRDAVSPIW